MLTPFTLITNSGLTDWSSVVDGVEFKEEVQILASKGLAVDVPVLLGTNRNEGTDFAKLKLENSTHADRMTYLESQLHCNASQAESVIAQYCVPTGTPPQVHMLTRIRIVAVNSLSNSPVFIP